MKCFAALALIGAGLAHAATTSTLPVGAEALGYAETLFDNSPTLASVSVTGNDANSQWYAGQPGHSLVQNLAQREMLSTVDGHLAIPLGSAVLSVTRRYTQAALPLLDGSKGFYVEFTMHLSSNDPDHFYGLYLLPCEHNIAKSDHFAGDPAGFERWTEIDVSESGFGPGSLNTVINWWGNYPQYSKQFTNSYGHDKDIDFTKAHRFGVSYDPVNNVLQWYLDDVPTFKASTLSLSRRFHYEIVMDADSHGAYKPYQMYVHNVRAFVKGAGSTSAPATNPDAAQNVEPKLSLNSAPPTVPSGSSTSIPLSASHFDGNSFSLQVVQPPSKGTVHFNGNVAIYSSSAGSSGTDSFTVRAFDQLKTSTPLAITVKIQAAAPAPRPSTAGTTTTTASGGSGSTTTGTTTTTASSGSGSTATGTTTTTASGGSGSTTTGTTTATASSGSENSTTDAATTTTSSGGGGSMDTWALALLLMGVGMKKVRLRTGPVIRGSY